jgi:D-alanyl-lipoteichoic acid acyltransferase DltB (MBOAT superfamily)
MSLSSFYRDYVYIPLGGNRKHMYFNLAVVFLLTGIWHGAYYTFIAWGIWHGFFIVMERVMRNWRGKRVESQKKEPGKIRALITSAAGYVYTMAVVLIGWVMFRTPTVPHGVAYLQSMFGLNNISRANYIAMDYYLDQETLPILLLALVMSTPLPEKLYHIAKKYIPDTLFEILQNVVLLVALLLCILQVASSTYSEFIYFQF